MAAVNDFQLEVVEEFLQLCKKFSNGYFDECYQDLLNKIQLLEIKDHLSKRQLQLFSLDYTPHKTSDPLITYGQTPLDKTSSTLQTHQSLASVFGKVVYNSTAKKIYFYNKDANVDIATPIAEIDATDFIKDGMVDNVYIKNNTLVITFNADAKKQAIRVPLTSIFNPKNYYTRTQIVNLLDDYYTKSQVDNKITQIDVDTSGLAQIDERTNQVKYTQTATNILDAIELPNGEPITVSDSIIYGNEYGHIIKVVSADTNVEEIDLGVAPQIVFLNKADDNQYRWTGSTWQQVGGQSGYNVTFDNGNVIFSGSMQPIFDNGNIIL